MSPRPSITVVEQFEVYNELVRRSRRSMYLAAALLLLTVLSMGIAFLSFTRPLPVVIVSDDPAQPRRVSSASDVSVREVDAKRFFYRNALRLHGWSSLDVVSELTAASQVMTTRWRKRFVTEMNQAITVPVEVDATGKASQLQGYVAAKIRNEVSFDWESAACARTSATSPGQAEQGPVWHCRARATMNIQPLVGDPVSDPKLKKRIELRASFVEVRVTEHTLDGLMIDFWDAQLARPDPTPEEGT